MSTTTRYPIRFDPEAYRAGSGTEFIPASASLDGDWICEYLGLPFDRYYTSFEVQQEANARAREIVEAELGLPIVPRKVFDHGVILNASLFGGRVRYHANSTPVLEPVVTEPGDVAMLAQRIDAVSDEGLLHEGMLHPEYWGAAERLEREEGIAPSAPASGGTKGIATVCGQLCGVTNFLLWLYTNPSEMETLTALVGRTFRRYIRASRAFDDARDTDGLAFASDLTGLMSPDDYARFCAPQEEMLYETFAPHGERYYHADSNLRRHVAVLAGIGVTTVNIGPMVSVTDILTAAPGMKIDGQVPPTQVLWRGTPDLVVDAVRRDIDELESAGGSLGQLRVCTAGSINPGTPLENIRAMYWAAMTYGRFDRAVSPELASIPVEFDRSVVVDQVS
ncbi:MAG: uroporphyrinogen decarboxylase family protein [Spirochaetota bacterium]